MPQNYGFIQRNFVADFLQAKCNFTRKTAVLHFLSPSPLGEGLWATYDDHHLMLIGKRVKLWAELLFCHIPRV